MLCQCNSHKLYQGAESKMFKIDEQQLPQARKISKQQPSAQQQQILQSIFSSSQIYLPIQIDKISVQEIYTNPLWFYKNYMSLNKPCIIVDGLAGDIVDTWANPLEFRELTQSMQPISVSVTPDGFADSIKNKYFIEPLEIKAKIRDVIDWKEAQMQNNLIKPEWIPYIQHQNSNLTEQMSFLTKFIDDQMKNFITSQYFQGSEPDASNFWMGYDNSVSAMHKDPYQNFYTTIVGEKHFTLLPPISISYLQQQSLKSAKWSLTPTNQFVAKTNLGSDYDTARWICCNPDLKSDYELFPRLEKLKDVYQHVVVEAGESLYLPSLWYHQVAQVNKKNYTIAVNYWFDMNFNHNYSLYEAIRKIKNYP